MNKLVSKNSVQRFKQGQQIQKFQNGGNSKTKFVKIGRNGSGQGLYRGSNGELYKKNIDNSYVRVAKKGEDYKIVGFGGDLESSGPFGLLKTIPANYGMEAFNNANKEEKKSDSSLELKLKREKVLDNLRKHGRIDAQNHWIGSTINENQKPKSNKPKITPTNSNKSAQSSSPLFYGTAIGGKVRNDRLNYITDAQKQKLINTGKFKDSDFNTVTNFQTALNNYFVGDPEAGSIKVDNLWGDQTEKAFNFALEKADTPTAGNLNTTSVIQTTPIQEVKIAPTIQNLPPTATKTYNRSQTRDYMRDLGLNPYDYTGAERKALRMYLNGTGDDKDKVIAQNIIGTPQFTTYTPSSDFTKKLTMLDAPLTLKYNMKFEKGGLISKNPIERFKINFR